jgi:hypothetical protein
MCDKSRRGQLIAELTRAKDIDYAEIGRVYHGILPSSELISDLTDQWVHTDFENLKTYCENRLKKYDIHTSLMSLMAQVIPTGTSLVPKETVDDVTLNNSEIIKITSFIQGDADPRSCDLAVYLPYPQPDMLNCHPFFSGVDSVAGKSEFEWTEWAARRM